MFIFLLVQNITFSKYAFYFISNSLYFITLYIIKGYAPLWNTNWPFCFLHKQIMTSII